MGRYSMWRTVGWRNLSRPSDMAIKQSTDELRELALFAGAGGGILGGHLLGWRTICAVERDAYCAAVLAQRQNDGTLAPFPIWSDVTTFDGNRWRGRVDVVSGGFPCQDISVAGKGDGLDGARSSMWFQMAGIIREVEPRFVYVENSPALTSRGLGRVLADLAALRFDARWGVYSAGQLGAPHLRERIWICANSVRHGLQEREHVAVAGSEAASPEQKRGAADRIPTKEGAANAECWNVSLERQAGRVGRQLQPISRNRDWPLTSEPVLGRGTDGLADRLDRLKALGNGQVPRVHATAWRLLSK